jgi:DNA-binding transcriptional MocR family regulator
MLDALSTHAPAGSTWSHPEGGYFVWLEVDGADSSALAVAAEREGVTFIAGSGFFPAASNAGAGAARLAYSYETPERITEGVERISRLLG